MSSADAPAQSVADDAIRQTAATPSIVASQISRTELFCGFLCLGMLGFGGIAPWARHIIVERRRWIDDQEYAAYLGVGQVLPGPNTLNAAVMIGARFHGAIGAAIAIGALMAAPLLALILLAELYQQCAGLPDVRAALAGAGAAVAGIVLGTAIKMARKLRPDYASLAVGGIAFAAVGVFSLPMVPVVAVLLPLSLGLTLLGNAR